MIRIRNRLLRLTFRTLLWASTAIILVFFLASVYIEFNKKEILSEAVSSLSKKINGKVSYSDADISVWKHFPFVALDISNARLADSTNINLLEVENILFRVSLLQIVRKKTVLNHLSLKNGSIFLFTDSTGYTNRYVFDKNPQSDQRENRFDLNRAKLKNVRVVIDNRVKNKRFDVLFKNLDADISSNEKEITILLDQNAMINGLGFNLAKGSYLKKQSFKGRTRLHYDRRQSLLSFNNSRVKIDEQPFVFSGAFRLKDAGSFSLDIKTSEAPFKKLAAILADSTFEKLSKISFQKPIDVTARLEGLLAFRSIPKVSATWIVKQNTLTTPMATISNCSFAGTFTNEVVGGNPRTDANSGIFLSGFSGDWEQIQLKSERISITDLVTPRASMSLQSSADLKSLNEKIGLRTIRFLSGSVMLNFDYNGPLQSDISIIEQLAGRLRFTNASVQYIPRGFTFNNCSGDIVFSADELRATDLRFDLGSNHFDVDVEGANLSALSVGDAGKAVIQCRVSSPSLNLAELNNLFSKKHVTAESKEKGKMLSAAAKIDDALDQGQLKVFLTASTVHYQKFTGRNLKGTVLFYNNDLHLSGVSIDHAGGSMLLDGNITQQAQSNTASARVKLNNVDVATVFRSFDDFGQDGIGFQNLRGSLNAITNFSMTMDRAGKIVPGTMNGSVQFSLRNGALLNYEPMQNIKGFVFKNKDMSNIAFAELKNKLEIERYKITIPRMEIQSTAIGMFVEGVYDLKKAESEIKIQVPLKGIKKRDSSYVPQNIGVDSKAGTSIYLQGKNDKTGKVKIGLNTSRTLRKIF